MKNSPQKLPETQYFLVTVDWVLMALGEWFKQGDVYADNFRGFFYCLKKFKEMKEEHLKTQCMKRHTALLDEDSHNINNVGFSQILRF